MSHARIGESVSTPCSNSPTSSHSISWIRSGPASSRSNDRYRTPAWVSATVCGSRTSALPISMNRPPRGNSSNDASTNSPASASSTTSTPAPPVTCRNGPGTPDHETTRSDRRRDAEALHRGPLRRARRRKHLRTHMPGDLHRRHAHATGSRMHQHPLTPTQTSQIHQPVVGGQEHQRHRTPPPRTTNPPASEPASADP